MIFLSQVGKIVMKMDIKIFKRLKIWIFLRLFGTLSSCLALFLDFGDLATLLHS